ncbi:RING finger protein 34 [Coemansia sp. RSA 2322]|nr:RING finger protein 34 [Coemansia sp. RSA 2322]
MVQFNALPFPASNTELPPAIEDALRGLNGPLRDCHNCVYELAKPLERSRYSACPTCGTTFNLFRRKNNCVNCGQVVCSDCLDNKWYLPKYGLRTPVSCCTMCDRSLHTSIMSKQDLGNCPIRELRAYLQLYGLYNPNTMFEKGDLVSAIYKNSPVPQINERQYRDSLPRPSGSASSSRQPAQQQQQQRHAQSVSSSSDRTNNWERMFSDIGNEIGRGMENLGQQLGDLFETRPSSDDVPELRELVRKNTKVNELSIRVLKLLLAKSHVDYSNIVEKHELVQRVERLVVNTKLEMDREAAANSHSDGKGGGGGTQDADDNLCRICWDAATNSVFLNCGHMCTCLECGEKIMQSDRRECPICREYITRIVHVFRA